MGRMTILTASATTHHQTIMTKKFKPTWESLYQWPRPYVIEGEYINTCRPQLNGDGKCPRCQHPLFRDLSDLFCLRCGWRESAYFHGRLGDDIYIVNRLICDNYRLA